MSISREIRDGTNCFNGTALNPDMSFSFGQATLDFCIHQGCTAQVRPVEERLTQARIGRASAPLPTIRPITALPPVASVAASPTARHACPVLSSRGSGHAHA